MKKPVVSLAMALTLMLAASSCYSLHHEVGSGAQGSTTTHDRQWYVLWGLVPIGSVDSKALAEGASDYTISTEHSIIDILFNMVTGLVTLYSQTVTVKH